MAIEHINELDTLNAGREKINKALDDANAVLIEATDKDIISAPEIILARGGAQTLGERLDSEKAEVTAQLAQKAPQTDVDNLTAGKIDKNGSGQVSYANLAQDVRVILAGDRVPIVEDDSIITTNLTNSAVTPIKTTFFEVTGKNLFDKNNVTRGKYANYLTGELISSSTFGVSDYIPILPGIFYTKSNTQQIPFFDENKNIIPGIDGQTRFQTPSNACYVRINFLLAEIDSVQLELGLSTTNYAPYQPKIKDVHISDSDKVVKKVLGKNLFDKSKAIKDQYIAFDTGLKGTVSGYYASDYISLDELTTYTKNNINQFAFYDRYKQYISGLTDGTKTFTTPQNAKYGRFTIKADELNHFQLEKGSQFTGFEEYGYRLPSAVSSSAKGFVVVGLEKGDYSSIQEAYNQTVGDVVIVVLQGTYFESLRFKDNTRKVSLLGVDRENCIVQDNSGDYYKAPLDAKPNLYVENMTFISTHTDNTPYDIPSYAVHLDSGGSGTAYFKNCKMVSYQNSAVGIGTHQDQTIILDGCEIVKISELDGGALYMHNAQASNVTNQKVITKNCLIKTNIGFAIKVDDANTYNSGTNSQMDITFQFNILDSGTRSKDQRVWYRDAPVNGGVSGQIKLTSDSFGNNDAKINA